MLLVKSHALTYNQIQLAVVGVLCPSGIKNLFSLIQVVLFLFKKQIIIR